MEVRNDDVTLAIGSSGKRPTKSTARQFERAFMRHLEPGDRILDLGCGRRAEHARALVEAGFTVDAVDREALLAGASERLHFTQTTIEEWAFTLTDERWNGVLMAGILHFLDPVFALSTLLPRLKKRIKPGGVIGISTFYKEPDPHLPVRTRSLYTLQQLSIGFDDWEIHGRECHLPNGTSMSGTEHAFWKTLLVARAPATTSA